MSVFYPVAADFLAGAVASDSRHRDAGDSTRRQPNDTAIDGL